MGQLDWWQPFRSCLISCDIWWSYSYPAAFCMKLREIIWIEMMFIPNLVIWIKNCNKRTTLKSFQLELYYYTNYTPRMAPPRHPSFGFAFTKRAAFSAAYDHSRSRGRRTQSKALCWLPLLFYPQAFVKQFFTFMFYEHILDYMKIHEIGPGELKIVHQPGSSSSAIFVSSEFSFSKL